MQGQTLHFTFVERLTASQLLLSDIPCGVFRDAVYMYCNKCIYAYNCDVYVASDMQCILHINIVYNGQEYSYHISPSTILYSTYYDRQFCHFIYSRYVGDMLV